MTFTCSKCNSNCADFGFPETHPLSRAEQHTLPGMVTFGLSFDAIFTAIPLFFFRFYYGCIYMVMRYVRTYVRGRISVVNIV